MYYYVYKITQKDTGMFYIGKRVSKLPPNEDLGIKYFSSTYNKVLKHSIKTFPDKYEFKVLKECDSDNESAILEANLLKEVNAEDNPMCFNQARYENGVRRSGNKDVNLEIDKNIYKNHSNFIKVFTKIDMKLSLTYQAKVYTLSKYLEPFTNRLVSAKRDNVIALTKQDIGEILNLGRTGYSSFLSVITDTKIIKVLDGEYYINPVYMMNGNRLSKKTIKLFEDCPKFRKSLTENQLKILEE